MKLFDFCASLLLLTVFLTTTIDAYPIEDTNTSSKSDSIVVEDSLDLDAAASSLYDDEIVSRVVEIVNLALDALQS